jgi:ABC-2 type transport system permease protein
MIAIYRRELRSLFRGVLSWILIAAWLLLGGLSTVRQTLGGASSLFSNVLRALSPYLVVSIPLLAVRSFTADQSKGAILWIRSLPVSATGLFLGKYLAALTVFALPTVFYALFPPLLANFGYVAYGSAYTALFGYFLLGASWLAVCCFAASRFRRVWVACLVTLLLGAVVYLLVLLEAVFVAFPLIGFLICLLVCAIAGTVTGLCEKRLLKGILIGGIPAVLLTVCYFVYRQLFSLWIPRVIRFVALFERLDGFCSGYLDLSALVLYVSVLGLAGYFAVNYPLANLEKGGKKQ